MHVKTFTDDYVVDSLNEIPNINKITYLDIRNSNVDSIPFLPNLQIFLGSSCKFKRFPTFPVTVRHIDLNRNRITELPNLDHLTNLEELHVNNCDFDYIRDLRLPPSLKFLDLSYCILTYFSINNWPPEIFTVNLSYNHLKIAPRLPEIILHSCNLILHQNDFIIANTRRIIGQNQPIEIDIVIKNIYNENQNVHASSVQKSVNKSIEFLIKSGPIQKEYHTKMKNLLRRSFFSRWFAWFDHNYDILFETFTKDTTIHSVHGINFYQLFGYIYNVIENHENQSEIIKVLKQEMRAGYGMCFTGRFSRVINSLCGFIPEITISVSPREEMQANISALLTKNKKRFGGETEEYILKTKKEMEKILDTYEIDPVEKEAWLDAI